MHTSKKLFRLWSLAAIVAMLVATVPVGGPAVAKPVSAQPTDLFFSEYVEGSSLNKALEIYNGTGSPVDLAAGGYSIEIYFNGSTSAGTTIALLGTLADGDVYVVADDGADPAILAETDQTPTSNFFNGDDAIVLRKAGAVIDSIGQLGVDPGSQYGSGETSTADNTLRRIASVCQGDTNPDDAFDPATEWDGFAQDTFDGLGAHTADCGGEEPPPSPVINEFVFNHTGSDTNEYIEIFGDGDTDYSAFSVLEVEGDGSGAGVIDGAWTVGMTNTDGIWVTGFLDNELENGTVSLLLVEGFTGSIGDDLDTDNDGVFEEAPWGQIVDDVAVTAGGDGDIAYSNIVLQGGFDGVSFQPGGASRIPNGTDTDSVTDWVRNDFDGEGLPGFVGSPENGEAVNTPGASNALAETPPPQIALVINEIMQNPDAVSDGAGEWFELFNPTGADIDINGWTILDNDSDSHIIDNGGPLLVPAHGYLVLGNNTDTASNGGAAVDYSYGSSWFLANGADEVVILDGTLNEIDRVEYDGGPGFPDPNGASMALVDPELDNNVGANWCESSVPYGDGDLGTPGAANNCAASPPEVAINEIRIDQPGGDDDEYFELAGAADTSLDGLTYLVIGDGSGGSGVIENVTDLSGSGIGGSGFFVGAEDTFTLGSADLIADLNFENSDNVTHLLVWEFTGSNGDDLDTNDDGVLDVEPWTEIVDSVALVETVSSGDQIYSTTTVGPDGSFVPGQVYRCEEGWRIGSFGTGVTDTPGSENDCTTGPEFGACGAEATMVHDVQGDGFSSPLVGSAVVVEGIVVGDFVDGLNGYFLQEEVSDADDNPQTSEGIFVDGGISPVDIGDVVRVLGTVEEAFGRTQLTDISDDEICGMSDLPAPVELTLPVTDTGDFEPFEGMYVVFPQNLHISEFFNFDRFGEIVLTVDRQYQPTAIHEPGSPEAFALAEQNELSRITLDDGRSSQNPDPAIHPNGEEFTLTNRFRGGDIVANAVGVLDYGFGIYRLQPTEGADYPSANPRPAEDPDVGGDLQVAAFNVLNYFTTIDQGQDNCGPSGDLECRGADTAEELERQRAKIVAALAELNADVVGLIEIQNDGDDGSVADLVTGLNDELGAGSYDYIATGFIGTDAIKQAFIYQPGSVTPVGDYAVLDSPEFVNPNTPDPKNRPALTQTFMSNETGGLVTVSVNHLKSKGSPCGEGDDDPLAGSCNLTRTLAAQELVDWLASGPTGYPEAPVMIIGDLNSYDKEDPIDVFKAAGYTDLLFDYQGELAYSYVFDGQLGYLDYAMASSNLLASITGTDAWHINADEPDILDYDTTFKKDPQDALYAPNEFRSSDHDPVVTGLTPLPQCNGLNATIYVNPAGVIVGGPWDGRDYEHVIFGTSGDDVIVGTELSDVIHGRGGDDVICGLDGDDVIQARQGDDYLDAGGGNDVVIGHSGDDVLIGGSGHDILIGMQGNDELYGGPGRDLLNGHQGDDVCYGGEDTDRDMAIRCEEEFDIP